MKLLWGFEVDKMLNMDGQDFGNCCIGQAYLKSWLRPWAQVMACTWQLPVTLVSLMVLPFNFEMLL